MGLSMLVGGSYFTNLSKNKLCCDDSKKVYGHSSISSPFLLDLVARAGLALPRRAESPKMSWLCILNKCSRWIWTLSLLAQRYSALLAAEWQRWLLTDLPLLRLCWQPKALDMLANHPLFYGLTLHGQRGAMCAGSSKADGSFRRISLLQQSERASLLLSHAVVSHPAFQMVLYIEPLGRIPYNSTWGSKSSEESLWIYR